MCSRSFRPYRTPWSAFQYARMPSKTAVPYMNAWVMMLTLASPSGDVVTLEIGHEVVRRVGAGAAAGAGPAGGRVLGLLGQHLDRLLGAAAVAAERANSARVYPRTPALLRAAIRARDRADDHDDR